MLRAATCAPAAALSRVSTGASRIASFLNEKTGVEGVNYSFRYSTEYTSVQTHFSICKKSDKDELMVTAMAFDFECTRDEGKYYTETQFYEKYPYGNLIDQFEENKTIETLHISGPGGFKSNVVTHSIPNGEKCVEVVFQKAKFAFGYNKWKLASTEEKKLLTAKIHESKDRNKNPHSWSMFSEDRITEALENVSNRLDAKGVSGKKSKDIVNELPWCLLGDEWNSIAPFALTLAQLDVTLTVPEWKALYKDLFSESSKFEGEGIYGNPTDLSLFIIPCKETTPLCYEHGDVKLYFKWNDVLINEFTEVMKNEAVAIMNWVSDLTPENLETKMKEKISTVGWVKNKEGQIIRTEKNALLYNAKTHAVIRKIVDLAQEHKEAHLNLLVELLFQTRLTKEQNDVWIENLHAAFNAAEIYKPTKRRLSFSEEVEGDGAGAARTMSSAGHVYSGFHPEGDIFAGQAVEAGSVSESRSPVDLTQMVEDSEEAVVRDGKSKETAWDVDA